MLPATASRGYTLMPWFLRPLSVKLNQKRSYKPWVLDSQGPDRVNVFNQILGYILTIQKLYYLFDLRRPVTLRSGQTLCHARTISSDRDILVSYIIGSTGQNALMCQAQVSICVVPFIDETCNLCRTHLTKMPTAEGKLFNKSINVLRDTGCSTVVVRRDLVLDECLTGETAMCGLIDGTVRRNPLTGIAVDTRFLKGTVTATCMSNTLTTCMSNTLRLQDTTLGPAQMLGLHWRGCRLA